MVGLDHAGAAMVLCVRAHLCVFRERDGVNDGDDRRTSHSVLNCKQEEAPPPQDGPSWCGAPARWPRSARRRGHRAPPPPPGVCMHARTMCDEEGRENRPSLPKPAKPSQQAKPRTTTPKQKKAHPPTCRRRPPPKPRLLPSMLPMPCTPRFPTSRMLPPSPGCWSYRVVSCPTSMNPSS